MTVVTTSKGDKFDAVFASNYEIRAVFYASLLTDKRISEVATCFEDLEWIKVENKETGLEYTNTYYLTLDSVQRGGGAVVDIRLTK